MTPHTDPRVAELEQLAEEEGITLPLPVDLMLFLEDRGKVVCLTSGVVLNAVTVTTTSSGKAVAHLLAGVVGEMQI